MVRSVFSRRRVLSGIAATALAVLGAGWAPSGASAQDTDVVLGALRFTSHSAGFIAFEKGYFREEGLNVTFKFFEAAQPIAVATVSGDVDFGISGVTGGLVNLAEKDAIRIVGGVLHEEEGVDGMMIVASRSAFENGLDEVSKMKGHSFANTQAGSTWHYAVSRVAQAEGFDVSDLRMVPLQKVGAMVAALRSGQVDTMIMVPDIAKPLVESGEVKLLGWVRDSYPGYQISTMFTSTANIAERRDVVERFLRAYSRGIADFNRVMLGEGVDAAEQEAMIDMIANYVAPDKPREEAALSIRQGAMHLNEEAALDLADVRRQVEWMEAEALVDSGVDMDKLVDTSFVKTY